MFLWFLFLSIDTIHSIILFVVPTLLHGAVSLTLLALRPWHPMARPRVTRRSPQESQPSQHRVHLASRSLELGLPSARVENMQGSLLQRVPIRKSKPWCSRKASDQSLQQEASDRDSWRSSVRQASSQFQTETGSEDSWCSSVRQASSQFQTEAGREDSWCSSVRQASSQFQTEAGSEDGDAVAGSQ